jgi:tetratricopeptide (TPR) repeat protein
MLDLRQLWDFDDPAASEARFRDAASGDARLLMLTQVARARGLQGAFDDGHSLLDGIAADPALDTEGRIRVHLERGRLLRSADRVAESVPEFETAARLADEAGEEFLHLDALHMLAIAQPAQAETLTLHALDLATRARDPEAGNWDASLLNNLGMSYVDEGRLAEALATFESALQARLRIGRAGEVRVARWMIAWTLRLLGRTDDALTMQRALQAELEAAGEQDPYVDEELALLDPEVTPGGTPGP